MWFVHKLLRTNFQYIWGQKDYLIPRLAKVIWKARRRTALKLTSSSPLARGNPKTRKPRIRNPESGIRNAEYAIRNTQYAICGKLNFQRLLMKALEIIETL